jgi:hypothetical protein
VGKPQNPAIRRTRAALMVEMQVKGVTTDDISKHFNVSKQRVGQITKWAEAEGLVDEVRAKMQMELIPAAAAAYKEILDAPAVMLADKSVNKGYALKLNAAKQVSEGLGTFRKAPTTTFKAKAEVPDLEGYYELRKQRALRASQEAEGLSHAEIIEADFIDAAPDPRRGKPLPGAGDQLRDPHVSGRDDSPSDGDSDPFGLARVG